MPSLKPSSEHRSFRIYPVRIHAIFWVGNWPVYLPYHFIWRRSEEGRSTYNSSHGRNLIGFAMTETPHDSGSLSFHPSLKRFAELFM